jgi:uncharacterized iron-regulated membrane protein
MQALGFTSLRLVWRRVHLWIALGIGLFLVPIGLTGAALVFHEELDRLIDPALYAVTAGEIVEPPGAYVARAAAAVPGAVAVRMRFPESAGAPITVLLRGGGSSGADSLRVVYVDPPTGRVLGVRDFRGTVVGLVHSFHANLLLQAYNGRDIVGWNGIGLFVLALTGLYLWWPRNSGFVRGLRWRRGPLTSINLHHMTGFWICIPLAVLAGTGVVMSFPQQARSVIGLVAETGPRAEPGGKPLARPVLDANRAVSLASAGLDGGRVLSLAFPAERGKAWRVQLARGEDLRTVTVEDATGKVTELPEALPGDAFTMLLRRLHEGEHHGPVWRAIVFVTGFAPAILMVTGVLMWLRRAWSATSRPRGERAKVAVPAIAEQDAAA